MNLTRGGYVLWDSTLNEPHVPQAWTWAEATEARLSLLRGYPPESEWHRRLEVRAVSGVEAEAVVGRGKRRRTG